jgi:hypothetical protein
MSRGAQKFRQADLTKALKAAAAAGMTVQRFEIERDGKLVVFTGCPGAAEPPAPGEWDAVR